ncbi:hypothetical protein E2320_014719, partial [Naja naja]
MLAGINAMLAGINAMLAGINAMLPGFDFSSNKWHYLPDKFQNQMYEICIESHRNTEKQTEHSRYVQAPNIVCGGLMCKSSPPAKQKPRNPGLLAAVGKAVDLDIVARQLVHPSNEWNGGKLEGLDIGRGQLAFLPWADVRFFFAQHPVLLLLLLSFLYVMFQMLC